MVVIAASWPLGPLGVMAEWLRRMGASPAHLRYPASTWTAPTAACSASSGGWSASPSATTAPVALARPQPRRPLRRRSPTAARARLARGLDRRRARTPRSRSPSPRPGAVAAARVVHALHDRPPGPPRLLHRRLRLRLLAPLSRASSRPADPADVDRLQGRRRARWQALRRLPAGSPCVGVDDSPAARVAHLTTIKLVPRRRLGRARPPPARADRGRARRRLPDRASAPTLVPGATTSLPRHVRPRPLPARRQGRRRHRRLLRPRRRVRRRARRGRRRRRDLRAPRRPARSRPPSRVEALGRRCVAVTADVARSPTTARASSQRPSPRSAGSTSSSTTPASAPPYPATRRRPSSSAGDRGQPQRLLLDGAGVRAGAWSRGRHRQHRLRARPDHGRRSRRPRTPRARRRSSASPATSPCSGPAARASASTRSRPASSRPR